MELEDRPEEVGDDCNGSVRQVLDDVEVQIERLREAVTRLAEDKRGLMVKAAMKTSRSQRTHGRVSWRLRHRIHIVPEGNLGT